MSRWASIKKVLAKQYHPNVNGLAVQNMISVLDDYPKTKPHVLAYYLLNTIPVKTAELKSLVAYENAIDRQVSVRWALDGALNGGRDQPEWIEESNRNLLMFMMGESPSWIRDEVVYEHPDTPLITKCKIRFKWKALEYHYRYTKMGTTRALAVGAGIAAIPVIIQWICNVIV
ncbi:hypothetical protein VH22019_00042 [Vibrio phage VH2_2019]|nr:hypothetical protein VH22019_00042 [Vibrio phage VH2_2019]